MNKSLVELLNANTDETPDIQIITQSPYYSIEQFIQEIKKHKDSFTILSLNIQCLNAKFDALTILLDKIQSEDCTISAICIQETWADDRTNYDLYKLDKYNSIPQDKICSAHGGLCIYLHEMYTYDKLDLYNKSNIWEGQFIKIKNIKGRMITIGNIYRPPEDINLNYENFTEEFNKILTKLQRNNTDTIIAGDFNIDLLKIHDKQAIYNYFETNYHQGFSHRSLCQRGYHNARGHL